MSDPAVPAPAGIAPKKTRASGVVIPHQPKWYQWLASWFIWAFIRALALTLRYHWNDQSGYFKGKKPGQAIYCVWHNRLAICMIAYWDYAKKQTPTPGLAAMVSASKDGGFLTAVLERFGVKPVRGSSSRRGAQALRELTTWSRRGYDLAITPDGPRGPRYHAQDGIIALAQLTGLPILPISCNLRWKISLNSWDRFQIPVPFSRCEMHYAPPIHVPRQATPAERDELRLRFESTLRAISRD